MSNKENTEIKRVRLRTENGVVPECKKPLLREQQGPGVMMQCPVVGASELSEGDVQRRLTVVAIRTVTTDAAGIATLHTQRHVLTDTGIKTGLQVN